METFYKKNWLFKFRSMAFLAALLFTGSFAMAQLSGTYTIDSSSATSGTNFQSFTDFADTAYIYGVSGAVTVNVVANSGPYNQNVILKAISGTSSTKTITINGNGNELSSSTGSTLEFNGADYVKVDGLMIKSKSTAADARCIWIHNSSDNNTISNCELIISGYTGTATGNGYVVFSNSSSSYSSTGNHGVNTMVEDNLMWNGGATGAGPYHGIVDYRTSGNTAANSTFDGNEIRNVYFYFSFFYYSKGITFSNNEIHTVRSGAATSFAMYNYYGGTIHYLNNNVHDLKASNDNYGTYFYECDGSSSNHSELIGNTYTKWSGVYNYFNRIYYSDYFDVEDNDISGHYASSYNYYGYAMYYSNYANVEGNVFEKNEAGTYNYYGYYIYYSNYTKVLNNINERNKAGTYNYYGYYVYYSNYVDVIGNTYSYNESGSYNYYGFYIYQSDYGDINDNVYSYNKSTNYNYYAFYLYYSDYHDIKRNEYAYNSAGYNYYGFYLNYSTYLNIEENLYHHNNGTTYNIYAFYTYFCDNSSLSRNQYYSNTAQYNYYAFMLYYSNNSVMDGNVSHDNSASAYMYYSYYFYYCDGSKMINNMYYANDAAYAHYMVLYEGYNSNSITAHNTFIIDDDVDYYNYICYLYYYNSAVNIQWKNNLIYWSGDCGYDYAYPLYCPQNTTDIDFGYNVWYDISPTATKYYYANNTTYQTFDLWKQAAGDNTSLNINPMFVDMANDDYTPSNPIIANMGEAGLATQDFNRDTRTACGPDPGALEFFMDHSASNLVFSGTNECGDYTEEVKIDFNSGSSADMKDVQMFFAINGQNRVNEYIKKVSANSSETHTFVAKPRFNTPGVNTLTVGLGCDDDASNNTIDHQITITPSPSGSDLVEGSTWNGYWNTGNEANPDVTVPGEVIIYDILPPTKYANSDYGTDWTLTANSKTKGGQNVGASLGLTNNFNTGNVNRNITIDPDASLTDKMIYVSVTINDLVTGCDSTIGRWLYIPYTPTPDFISKDACFGDVNQLANTSTMGGTTFMQYVWRFNDPDPLITDDTSEAKLGVFQYSDYGTFDVTLEVRNQAYPKFVYSVTKSVKVTPTPEIKFQIVNACEGTDIQFINTTTVDGPGTLNYKWTFGDGANSIVKSPAHLYAAPKPDGYKVTLTATANGCTSELTKKAYQFAVPHADFTTNGGCNLEDIQFINKTNIAIGKAGYNWDFKDGGISTVKDPVHVFSTPGTKSVKLKTFSEFGCEDEVTLNVVLLESPEADFNFTNPCNLTPVSFTRTGSIPGTSNQNDFQWNFGGLGTSSDENPSFLFSQTGKKDITLTITSLNGCSSMVTKPLNVALQAKADFEAKDICEGDIAVFTNKSKVTAGELSYQWLFGDGPTSTSANTSPTHLYSSTGVTRVVNVTLTAIVEGGCNSVISKPLTVNAAPDASFTVDKQGRFVYLTGPADMTIYQWRFGNGASSTTQSPTYQYSNIDNEDYEICLTVKNELCWNENCEEVAIDLASIEGLTEDGSMINVYPNPTAGAFKLEVSNASEDIVIMITDILGNTIPASITDNLNGNYSVDLSNVADGVYFVQVKNGDVYATKRITVSK